MIKKNILIFIMLHIHFLIYNSKIPTTSGGTGISSIVAYALLLGGPSTTASLQQVPSTGISGQVLTCGATAVAPLWQNNNYGMTLLKTLTASTSPTLTLTSTEITTTYDVYLIELDNLAPTGAAVTLQAFFSNNNGSTYLTTGYLSGINSMVYNSNTITNTSSTTFIPISTPTSLYVSGYLYLYPNIAVYSGSGAVAFMNGQVISDYPGKFGMVVGYQSTAGLIVNNVKFQFSSGNISQGTIKLYGLKFS